MGDTYVIDGPDHTKAAWDNKGQSLIFSGAIGLASPGEVAIMPNHG